MCRQCRWPAVSLVIACAIIAIGPVSARAADPASALRVTYRGAISLPDEITAADGRRIPVTGVSGITWLGDDRYVAVMDNSRHLLRLRVSLTAAGTPGEATDLGIVNVATRHDYEDVAPRLGGPAAVYLCEEDTPAIRVFRLADGTADGEVVLPPSFRGRRANRGPEALALDPDGASLWTANEEALVADGPAPTVRSGTVVRIAQLPLTPGRAARQFAYQVDPPHAFASMLRGEPLAGVVAIVALGRGRLLVLERSAGPGVPPFESRLFFVDTTGAADVSHVERGLADRPETFVPKVRLWSDTLGINLEGLCLGPKRGADRRALVGVADNGGLGTPTQVTAFELAVGGGP